MTRRQTPDLLSCCLDTVQPRGCQGNTHVAAQKYGTVGQVERAQTRLCWPRPKIRLQDMNESARGGSPSKEDHHFPVSALYLARYLASATDIAMGFGNSWAGGTAYRGSGNPEKMVSGGKARTTNNEMEMTAAIEGLKVAIAQGAREITVVSDSEYLVKGMTGWVRGWLRNGWKTSRGEPVKNRPLWEELHRLSQGRSVTWSWIRGHAGHPENERCDAVAVAAAHEASKRR